MLQLGVLGSREEILVLGIGAGPAALNIIDTKLVQLMQDEHFVVGGKTDGLALGAVAQRGIEGEDSHIGVG